MLAVHREVIAVILEPDTPGGLRLSIDCRTESSSATADDIVVRRLFATKTESSAARARSKLRARKDVLEKGLVDKIQRRSTRE